MLRAYFFVALLATILYPLVWYFLFSSEAIHLIFGDLLLGTSAIVGIAIGSVFGLLLMQRVTERAPDILKGFFIRIIGALIAGFVPVILMYGLVAWESGFLPTYSIGWWNFMHLPGFISALTSYWIVSLLIKPVALLPIPTTKKNNRRR